MLKREEFDTYTFMFDPCADEVHWYILIPAASPAEFHALISGGKARVYTATGRSSVDRGILHLAYGPVTHDDTRAAFKLLRSEGWEYVPRG